MTFITWDRIIREASGGITPIDAARQAYQAVDELQPDEQIDDSKKQEAKTKLEGLINLTPSSFISMAHSADKTYRMFQDLIELDTTSALIIRRLRVTLNYSWRSVARYISTTFNKSWGGNQLAGMVLCEKAARELGENFMEAPWN